MSVAVLLFALVLVTARLSENRIVWIALAAAIIIAGGRALARVRPRMKIAFVAAALLVASSRCSSPMRRGSAPKQYSPCDSTVAESLATDPRLSIWKHAAERIARAAAGTATATAALSCATRSRDDTGDRLLTHAHNMFASQWLQTGAVGVALFVALLRRARWRYGRCVRSGDDDARARRRASGSPCWRASS